MITILYYIFGYLFTGTFLTWAISRVVHTVFDEQEEMDDSDFFTFVFLWPVFTPLSVTCIVMESDVEFHKYVFAFFDKIAAFVKSPFK